MKNCFSQKFSLFYALVLGAPVVEYFQIKSVILRRTKFSAKNLSSNFSPACFGQIFMRDVICQSFLKKPSIFAAHCVILHIKIWVGDLLLTYVMFLYYRTYVMLGYFILCKPLHCVSL